MTKYTSLIARGGRTALLLALSASLAGMAAPVAQAESANSSRFLGPPPIWGLDPNDQKSEQKLPADYDPKVLTIVRVSAKGNWGLFVNYASFRLKTGDDPAAVAAQIADVVKGGAGGNFRFALNRNAIDKLGHEMIERKGPPQPHAYDVDSFDYLGADQQTATVVWVDIPGANLIRGEYISFTPYDSTGDTSCRKTPTGTPQLIVENDSFIASAVPTSASFRNRPVMLIKNYFAKPGPNHTYIPREPNDPPVCYSMNIQFTITNNNGGVVPIAIDPNTGNGPGYEP